ncbi:hypothetical protein ABXT72_07070 [Candidatus Pelagibacter sp. Uisw_094]|uniref:hypothetical protein n=1 Tax=Candidatus Pelagibacter sp. Uisw_094 TaxID=3230980 RepID=UPI0039E7A60E|tara:strand:- start:360 stop:1559 length:1200 start_codon:yes stop_codon:yes gene_type:complete
MKKIIQNTILFLTSIFLTIVILNIIFIKVSNQNLFPRPLSGMLPNILLTFYPKTYDFKITDNYIAVLGDSYSQGGGDAYLSNAESYSVLHHMHKINKKNYLNFGRGGYGSILAISNFFKIKEISNKIFFIKNIPDPEEIIFLFYEGNDLEDNYYQYIKYQLKDETIAQYTHNRINKKLEIKSSEILVNQFIILKFLDNLYKKTKEKIFQLSRISNLSDLKKGIIDIKDKLFGKKKFLNSPGQIILHEKKNRLSRSADILVDKPIQGASINLDNAQQKIALEIFFNSIKYLKKVFNKTNITIVYIPSPISSYNWDEPIIYDQLNNSKKIKNTTNLKNSFNSQFIIQEIKNFTVKNKVGFIDTSKYIIRKAKNNLLHGPLDWNHFNYLGYNYLAESIVFYK